MAEKLGHVLDIRPVLLRNIEVRYAQMLREQDCPYESGNFFWIARRFGYIFREGQMFPDGQIIVIICACTA